MVKEQDAPAGAKRDAQHERLAALLSLDDVQVRLTLNLRSESIESLRVVMRRVDRMRA